MPAIKAEEKIKTELYQELKKASGDDGERNDCAVIALAAVTGRSYKVAHQTLQTIGRKDKDGTYTAHLFAAITKLGWSYKKVDARHFIDQYPKGHCNVLKNVSTHHPARFHEVWADGNHYLFVLRRHFVGVVDGVNHDWTKGRSKQVREIYQISRKGKK